MPAVTRRSVLAALLGTRAFAAARSPASLDRFFAPAPGAAILLDVRSRRIIAIHAADTAGKFPAPPGSTVKPFVLAALLRRGRITAADSLVCPGRLTIAGRSFHCVHPRVNAPVRIETALAYSCNCFVAHFAERFSVGELARDLQPLGFAVRAAADRDATRLQALGEQGILVTVAGMASAYRSLARAVRPEILAGLEGAVEYGTAQRAQVAGVQVAGKTGSVRTADGTRIAWFAGWLPSRAPEIVVAVMLQGHSGGSDAAPVAGKILAAYRTRRV